MTPVKNVNKKSKYDPLIWGSLYPNMKSSDKIWGSGHDMFEFSLRNAFVPVQICFFNDSINDEFHLLVAHFLPRQRINHLAQILAAKEFIAIKI